MRRTGPDWVPRLRTHHQDLIRPDAGMSLHEYAEWCQDVTRLDNAPRIMRTPGLYRLVFRMSAKFMRRGFHGLLALAEERAAAY